MHVDAVGNRSGSAPAFCIQNGGSSSLNPSKGGREQLVTNLSSLRFCSSDIAETTFQKSTIKRNLIKYIQSSPADFMKLNYVRIFDGPPSVHE